jgi:hypothetical protein
VHAVAAGLTGRKLHAGLFRARLVGAAAMSIAHSVRPFTPPLMDTDPSGMAGVDSLVCFM